MNYEITRREHFEAETGEALTAVQKNIVRLRAVKEARKLTVAQVEQMVNYSVSRTTLNRFFSADSETKYNFNYEYTILPIQRALLVEDTIETGDEIAKAKVSGFEAAIQQKEEEIAALKAQVERMRQEYEKRLELWQRQIELKDKRIDTLMDKIDKLIDKALG